MDEKTNEPVVEEGEELTPEPDLTTETDWEAEAKKARGIAQRALTKLKKMGEKKEEKPVVPVEKTQTTSELNNADYALLTAKGIEADDEVQIYEDAMKKTGMSLRDVLKDEYYTAKLTSIRSEKEVKAATPGSTRRSGSGSTDSVELALAKYKQTGTLPTDFTLRAQVVASLIASDSPNKPSWRK